MRTFIISLLIGALFFSCENRSCTDVVCAAPNSSCIDGQCYCDAGLEGDLCEIFSYEKYIGSYQVSEGCTTTFGGYRTQQFSSNITVPGRIDVLSLNNFANRGLPVDATIVSANFLTITSQNIGAVSIAGGEGRYEAVVNRIRFEYNYTAGTEYHQCTAIYTRF